VLLNAQPTSGHNLQRAVDEIAAADGVSKKVTHPTRRLLRCGTTIPRELLCNSDWNGSQWRLQPEEQLK
jgi:hypothetical protein